MSFLASYRFELSLHTYHINTTKLVKWDASWKNFWDRCASFIEEQWILGKIHAGAGAGKECGPLIRGDD
jgi:hypothetical protein